MSCVLYSAEDEGSKQFFEFLVGLLDVYHLVVDVSRSFGFVVLFFFLMELRIACMSFLCYSLNCCSIKNSPPKPHLVKINFFFIGFFFLLKCCLLKRR